MKLILILAMLVAAAVARPQELSKGVVPILDYQLVRDLFGQFGLSYLSGDGTKVTEEGALVPNHENTGHVLIKKGSFSYYAPDGTLIEETWTADADHGFQAMGAHLPTTPASPHPAPTSV